MTRATIANSGQGDDLGPEQADLGAGGELDPDHHDRGHHRDPDHADQGHRRRSIPRPVPADQLVGVEAGDLGQVGHHDDVGDDDRPAGDPAQLRAHRLGYPGEAGAAVRVGFVQVVVAAGDEEHRDEAHHQDRRGLEGHEAATKPRVAARLSPGRRRQHR